MSFGCGVHAMKLNQNGKSSKNSMPHDKACEEFGGKRKSRTSNLDPSRSHLNEYHVPEGVGPRGEGLADWLSQRLALASAERVKNGGRRYSSLTAVGASFTITPDEEAVATWDAATRARFRDDAIESIGVFIGHAPAAWAVHVDEGGIAERGLTRSDELGDQGFHIHAIDPMTDAEGNYRSRDTMSRARIKEMHRVFVDEMRKRGWDMDEHKSVKQREADGDVVLPGGLSANAHRRMSKWARKQRADAARNAADAERNADMRRVIAENAAWNEEEARALDRRADELEREARDARVEISHEHRRLAAREDEADRMRARAEVALHGYEPPAGVTLVPPAAMPPELRALWRLTDGDEGDDAIGDIPGDLLGEDGEPDLDAANERVDDLADEFARERGYAQAYVDGDGVWLVTPPLEFMRQQDGYEDVESVDELTDDDRLYWSEKWWDEASLRIADAQVLGLDPTVPHPGIDEREAAVEAARADVERRDRIVGEREAAFERLASKRRDVVDALDAEIEAKRAKAARLDAEADEKTRWLEGAIEHVKEADAYVEQARADAEATRRAAEADAERTREEARAEREEALRGITDRAEERITGFLGRVVGDVSYIAYRTLSVMVEMGVGGERFASAARVCMDVINAMSEDAVGRPFGQTLAGRVQERVASSFARVFARDVRRDAAVREVDDAPQAGRSRDDGPEL